MLLRGECFAAAAGVDSACLYVRCTAAFGQLPATSCRCHHRPAQADPKRSPPAASSVGRSSAPHSGTLAGRSKRTPSTSASRRPRWCQRANAGAAVPTGCGHEPGQVAAAASPYAGAAAAGGGCESHRSRFGGRLQHSECIHFDVSKGARHNPGIVLQERVAREGRALCGPSCVRYSAVKANALIGPSFDSMVDFNPHRDSLTRTDATFK